jgi:hypothetical protein
VKASGLIAKPFLPGFGEWMPSLFYFIPAPDGTFVIMSAVLAAPGLILYAYYRNSLDRRKVLQSDVTGLVLLSAFAFLLALQPELIFPIVTGSGGMTDEDLAYFIKSVFMGLGNGQTTFN